MLVLVGSPLWEKKDKELRSNKGTQRTRSGGSLVHRTCHCIFYQDRKEPILKENLSLNLLSGQERTHSEGQEDMPIGPDPVTEVSI